MFRSIWSKARESEIVDTIAGLVGIVMLLVGVVLGAVALGAAPAHAAPAPTDGGKGTVEVFWAMPNGGTPEEVTWPQLHSPDGAVQCGVWYQVDTYKSKHVAQLIDDGLLHQGEDHAVVISWRFVYGGDCAPEIPPAPEPYTEYGEWGTWAVDCEAGHAERGRWSWAVTWEWTGEEWVAVLGPDVADVEQRDLTADELAECAPPTEEPTDPEPTTPTEPEPTDPTTTDQPTAPVDPDPTTPADPEPSAPVDPEPTPSADPTDDPEPSEPPTASSRIYTPDVHVTSPEYLAETGPEHAGAIAVAITLLLFGAALTLLRKVRSVRAER